MARPEVSCHPETLLPNARTVVSAALCYYAPEPDLEPGEGRLPRYTWFDAYAELREKLHALGRRLGGEYRVLVDENDHVDREGAVRSGVGFYGKNTMLITQAPRVLGRARDARHGRGDRALRAARARLRLVHALHRGLPHGSARRAGHARLDALPLVLDAGAGLDSRGVPRRARSPGLRLRHLPGRLPVEPRDREAPRGRGSARRRRAARVARRVARGTATRSCARATSACTSRARIRATCAATRSSRPETRATRSCGRPSKRTRETATRFCASTRSGLSPDWTRRRREPGARAPLGAGALDLARPADRGPVGRDRGRPRHELLLAAVRGRCLGRHGRPRRRSAHLLLGRTARSVRAGSSPPSA